MKIAILLLTVLMVGGASLFAAPVQCTPASGNIFNTSGPLVANFTCDPDGTAGNAPGDGLTVIGITIYTQAEGGVTGGTSGTTYGGSATTTNGAGLNNPGVILLSCVASGTPIPGCNDGPDTLSAFTGVGPIDVFGQFAVTVTGGANGTLPLLRGGNATIFYEAQTRPDDPGGVPEPGTLMLLGGGLLVMGIIRRRL